MLMDKVVKFAAFLWQNARICCCRSNSQILRIPRWPLKIYSSSLRPIMFLCYTAY